jgi:serine/threonine protein kinase
MIGEALGHYRIEAKLGEGGMGVVYGARDMHLRRRYRHRRWTVDRLHRDGARRRPHARRANRPEGVALREALRLAVQIASGLAAAHASGIVHRDLKPGNIMIAAPASPDRGLVKILDFGLAKLREAGDPTAATRTQNPRTEDGSIVGTAGYMSPEQADGRPVDARSDVFAFGAVLYQMVTGRLAFQGHSAVSTLAAVLHQEPAPITDVLRESPPDLDKLIARCLRKDRERRIQHMDDVKPALEATRDARRSRA